MAFSAIITSWIYAFPFKSVINGALSSAVAQLALSHAINFQLLLTPLAAIFLFHTMWYVGRGNNEGGRGGCRRGLGREVIEKSPQLDVVQVHGGVTSQRTNYKEEETGGGGINIYGGVHVLESRGLPVEDLKSTSSSSWIVCY